MNFIDRIIDHKDIPKNQEPSSFRLNMTGNVFTRVREYRNIGQSLLKKNIFCIRLIEKANRCCQRSANLIVEKRIANLRAPSKLKLF